MSHFSRFALFRGATPLSGTLELENKMGGLLNEIDDDTYLVRRDLYTTPIKVASA